MSDESTPVSSPSKSRAKASPYSEGVRRRQGLKLINAGLIFDFSNDLPTPDGHDRKKHLQIQGLAHPLVSKRLAVIEAELRGKFKIRKKKDLPPEAQPERDRQLAITVVRRMWGAFDSLNGPVVFDGTESVQKVHEFLEREFFPPEDPDDPEGANHFDGRLLESILSMTERVDEIDPLSAQSNGADYVYGSQGSTE